MSSDLITFTIPLLVILGVTTALAGYAAYLSLSVWRGLAVPLYRSRAFWTAGLAVIFVPASIFSGTVDAIFPPEYRYGAELVVYFGLYSVTLIVIYAWIDRTINTVIRLDFMRKDLLGWKRFRYVYWALSVFTLIAYVAVPGFGGEGGSGLLGLAEGVTLIVPIGYGAVALVIGSSRTRDLPFRSYARWGGFCMLVVFFTSVIYYFTTSVVLQDLPIPFISFGLYKMAKSLVPVGTMPTKLYSS